MPVLVTLPSASTLVLEAWFRSSPPIAIDELPDDTTLAPRAID